MESPCSPLNHKQLFQFILVLITPFALPALSNAEPFVPQNSNYNVITLPAHIIELHDEIQANDVLETGSTRASANLFSDIMSAYEIAVRDNSSRAYGRVLSLTSQWPESEALPVEIRNIHASVLQHYHEFDEALAIIDNAINDGSSNLTTQQIRFQIAMVRGDYALAQTACTDIASQGQPPEALNCQSQLQAATGQLNEAQDNLQAFMSNRARSASISQIFEILLTAGDVAARQGRVDDAEALFGDALRLNPNHHYLRLQYIDLLLAEQRYDDALRFISTIPQQHINEEVKIHYIRALEGLNSRNDEDIIATLSSEITSSFQEALQREERLPHKDMALFYFYVEKDPDNALLHAHQNWLEQKEMSDTLLLYRSALSVNDKDIINDVESWIDLTGAEDARLEALTTNTPEV